MRYFVNCGKRSVRRAGVEWLGARWESAVEGGCERLSVVQGHCPL
jgi:hypothetical protein